MRITILTLGITGMLGHTLFQKLTYNINFTTYGTTRKALPSSVQRSLIYENIQANNLENIANIISTLKPKFVINCIGIIKQLPSAKDSIPTISINALFPHQLAQICLQHNVKLIQISTDCVFSGNKGNYTEQDNPDPIDLYGRTKLLGEVTYNNCLTLRTSIIGRELSSQNGLVEWFISQKGKTVKGYDRAIYTGLTTQALAQIIEKIILEHPSLSGLWHVSSEPITKYQLLNIINETFHLKITIERDQTFICNRSLNSDRFRQHTGFILPTWESMITELYQTSHP